jgi:hypothetical protein
MILSLTHPDLQVFTSHMRHGMAYSCFKASFKTDCPVHIITKHPTFGWKSPFGEHVSGVRERRDTCTVLIGHVHSWDWVVSTLRGSYNKKRTPMSLGYRICIWEWFSHEVFQMMFLELFLKKTYCLQQEFIKTHQTMIIHKKEGLFLLPVLSRGFSESFRSLRYFYSHYLRETGQFLCHRTLKPPGHNLLSSLLSAALTLKAAAKSIQSLQLCGQQPYR